MPDLDELLPVQDVATLWLKTARSTVYELINSGELKSVRLGRRRFVRRSDLAEFIAGLEK